MIDPAGAVLKVPCAKHCLKAVVSVFCPWFAFFVIFVLLYFCSFAFLPFVLLGWLGGWGPGWLASSRPGRSVGPGSMSLGQDVDCRLSPPPSLSPSEAA